MTKKKQKFFSVYAVVRRERDKEDLILSPLYGKHKEAVEKAAELNYDVEFEDNLWYEVEECEVKP